MTLGQDHHMDYSPVELADEFPEDHLLDLIHLAFLAVQLIVPISSVISAYS